MTSQASLAGTSDAVRLSYKFQRLREQLREAIVHGEFAGRLPGERDLGRRFGANAKTINKALSDLSAEGLVIRQIGRGTFVAGSGGKVLASRGRVYWWVTPDEAGRGADTLIEKASRALTDDHGGDRILRVSVNELACRRTMQAMHGGLRGVAGVVLCGVVPDEDVMAEVMRRHIPTVLLGDGLEAPRIDCVVPDGADAGFRLTEYLVQLGQRHAVVLSDERSNPMLDRIYTGYHAACRRRQIAPRPIAPTNSLDAAMKDGEAIGVLSVGAAATRIAAERLSGAMSLFGKKNMACVLEPGDPLAEELGLTVYETPVDRMVDWATRLLHAWKPGQPPVQVVVPGRLIVRGAPSSRLTRRDALAPEPAEAIL